MADQPPLANLITLGARDFAVLRDFYRRLGWPKVMDDGEFAVFQLPSILLAIFPIAQLARDGHTKPDPAYLHDPEGNYFEITADNPVVMAARRAAGV